MSEPTPAGAFTPSGFFALRTPLLPFDELTAWGDGLQAPAAAADLDRLDAALAADRDRLRDRLRTAVARPEVREALFVASPDLEGRLDLWLRQPGGERGQKVERALVRYLARMAGRATPFGLFAGCSVGTLGPQTRLELQARERYRRHTRLDMDYLVLLTEALAREPELRRALAFDVNSSLYPARGHFCYCEVRCNAKGWTHHKVALQPSDYLEATLARARGGATPAELAAALIEQDSEASEEEAAEYVGDLIDNQVLVSELVPAVTGTDPVGGLAARLRRRGAITVADRLGQVREGLEALDTGGPGADPACYRRLARLLKGLPGEVHLGRLFQVDMVKPAAALTLGSAVLAEIRRGVALLHRLARRRGDDPLARFREAFVNRYEGREVPLVEALDEDSGIGFDTTDAGASGASALLDELTFPKPAEEAMAWGRREALLLRRLGEALAGGAGEIALGPQDLDEMAEPHPPPLPDAFAVLATLAARSEGALDRGEFRLMLGGVSGPSGARLLGRFCHADPQLHRSVEQHVRAEEALHPDAVFAEIVHLPEGRLGNILARPVLRGYEVPYLGAAGVPAAGRIPVTDLRVSVANGQVILRSERLGRRVMPRLTSAHNFHAGQGIYRFLCALQGQGAARELGWDWGPLRDAPFLPRVVSGRLVLARARWQVRPEDLRTLGRPRGAARFRAVQSWRAGRRLPRWIALADADNELATDLDNVLAAETFVELVKGRAGGATLVELFPGPDELCVRGPEGRFVHELVVPFVRIGQAAEAKADRPVIRTPSSLCNPLAGRCFAPGSEWLYAKLYTGPSTADQVLRDLVGPVVDTVVRSGAADLWFFVRYADPDWHLRLRFHGRPARLHSEVLPVLQAAAAPLLDDGRLWRLQLDTYEREVERYGGAEGISLAEQVFCADSEAVLELTAALAEDTRGDVRWRLALAGIDRLLNDLGLDADARQRAVCRMRDRCAAELRADTDVKHQLGAKFRPLRRDLVALLAPNARGDTRLAPGMEVLRRRSERLEPVVGQLLAAAKAGRLPVPLVGLACSLVHMHANRLLRSAHREQELVLYDFLTRLYASQAARAQ
jgi:thiopeptide-type bacteriocin biosynthesis protein